VALLEAGTVVGNYRIEKVLGQGGMGVVYRAIDLRLDRPVALKLLSGETAQDVRFRARFLRESHTAASVDHPNVLPIYEAAEVDGELFIAMRLVDGEDLSALLRREGALDPARACGLIAQVADALDAVHVTGLVHRDIKPSNVLIHTAAAREHAYLADFGITKLSSESTGLTATGAFVGTIDYAAPEVIRGEPLDARTDVYSLGCVLFECLTGGKPFERESQLSLIYAHLEDSPPSPRDRRPELPRAIDSVISRALAKNRDERFESAGALASAALAAVGAAPHPARPAAAARVKAKPPRRAERRRPGVPRLVLLGGVLALVIGGAAAALLSGGGDSGGPSAQKETTAAPDATDLAPRVPAKEGRSVVGSALTQAPGDSGYCSGAGEGSSSCTVVQITLGGTDQAVRADGVITRWAVRGGKGLLALRVIDGPAGSRRVVARGPAVTFSGSDVESFAARIPVDAGQRVGVEQGESGFLPFRYRDEATTADFYDPPLGTTPTSLKSGGSGAYDYEFLYNATIEPDDDRDGRGDLTQDPDHGGAGARCPSSGVIARGSRSSVVRVGDELFGCRRGVRTRIGSLGGGARFRLYRFRGDQLALVRVRDGRSSVLGFDLGDRRPTFSTPKTFGDDRPADWTVSDLVLGSNGNAAWMAAPRGAPDRAAVWTRSGDQVRAIDSGRLRPGSLRLTADEGDVIYNDTAGRTRQTGF
jgi:serine/threonine-protein kinase